jgi:hypothetical protein
MPDARDRLDSLASLDRRSVLVGAGSLAAGGGVVLASSDRADAAADVELGSITLTGGSFEAAEVVPVVDVAVTYDFSVGSADVATLRSELLVGESVIASEALTTDTTSLRNDTTLTGRITDADGYTAADFAPAVGETVSVEVPISVRFAVLDDAGDVLASDTVATTRTITVEHPRDSEYTAAIGVTGEIRTAAE